jgi:hypothetical protein
MSTEPFIIRRSGPDGLTVEPLVVLKHAEDFDRYMELSPMTGRIIEDLCLLARTTLDEVASGKRN